MIQAVLFDLDDTLFNTTGQLYVQARRKACKAMAKAGVPAREEQLYQDMLRLYEQCGPFSKIVLQRLLDKYHVPPVARPRILEAADQAYNSVNVGGITLYPGVLEMLERLKKKYKLVLLTTGWPEQQNKKIDVLHIRHYFDLITFDNTKAGAESSKYAVMAQALKAVDTLPEETVCVGDKITNEIKAGNTLGMVTVRVMQGSYAGLRPQEKDEHPLFTITTITELEDLLESLDQAGEMV